MAARLLLVCVLALGVFVMHTLGHPDGASGSGTSSTSHASGMDTMLQERDASAGVSMLRGTGTLGLAPEAASSTAEPDEPSVGMDLASLCLAVLVAWVLGAVLRAALVRRRAWRMSLRAVAAAVLPARPPLRPPDLARLSILRI